MSSDAQITGQDLEQLVQLANAAMCNEVPGVALFTHSPFDLGVPKGDRVPLPPGVRQLGMILSNPNDESTQFAVALYVVGKGPTVQLDGHTLLRWAVLIEEAAMPAHDAALDIGSAVSLRQLAKSGGDARYLSNALSTASRQVNAVADEVRAAVSDPATWLPIEPEDAVYATYELRRAPNKGVRP